ncbi:hypothetical protein [Bradyrhizobium sp. NBAIM01]|uniref:hypothetical protein n=1 Tax=Bradyrhizobium sp. NBAIM01 TaxID=2793818 RepID=UPI001CD7A706|nr:hypothetical protein [Bradyrhizobium sp. NBAIM01]MCA1510504.1 hypothetical protein [Bradyrhizobium sp. NBAIM01]
MSATIIDFKAFKANRHAAAKTRGEGTSPMALEGLLAPLFFFPLFLAWIPFCLMALPAADRETT